LLAINTPVIIDPACLENDFLQLVENMPGVIGLRVILQQQKSLLSGKQIQDCG